MQGNQALGIASEVRKAWHWLVFRLHIRLPRIMAVVERQLPLRGVDDDVYTTLPDLGWAIPSTVYQTWTAGGFGRSHRATIRALRKRNASFSFVFYDDAMIEDYMERYYGDHPIHDVFKNAQFGALRTDIWRYALLYERGGIYIDISKSIDLPLARLLTPIAPALISWEGKASPFEPSARARSVLQHPDNILLNWALMFAPRHPLLKRVIDGIVDKYPDYRGIAFREPKQAILDFTGPHHLTECLLAAADAGEMDTAVQASTDFLDRAQWYAPGAWVRYLERPAYDIARDRVIVR